MISEKFNLAEACGLLITLDSCRWDTAVMAGTPNLDKWLGPAQKAVTLSTYTPTAHAAMWLGHLPTVRQQPWLPYYTEFVRQPWRITTGPSRDADKDCGILFQGNNVIEGYRRAGFFVQGIGGISQFSTGSYLRTAFPWSEFIYYGPDMDEEPRTPRRRKTFPLNNIRQIVEMLKTQEKWFLFINCPEPHYPYDWGDGIAEDIRRDVLALVKFNLRSLTLSSEEADTLAAVNAGQRLHAMQIAGMKEMDRKIGDLFSFLKANCHWPIYAVVCADHGENFGEIGPEGKPLYGHMHQTFECFEVPLWMGIIKEA